MTHRRAIPKKSTLATRASSPRASSPRNVAPRVGHKTRSVAISSVIAPQPSAEPFDIAADIRAEQEELGWAHLMFRLNADDQVD